jgi:glucokinase
MCEEVEMILAGDIGGTKTHLALYDWTTERVEPMRLETFQSTDFTSLEEMLAEFLVPAKPPTPIDDIKQAKDENEVLATEPKPEESIKIDAACFGVAGPVIGNRSHTTNLPWYVEGAALAARFDIPDVRLLNDLEWDEVSAHAYRGRPHRFRPQQRPRNRTATARSRAILARQL